MSGQLTLADLRRYRKAMDAELAQPPAPRRLLVYRHLLPLMLADGECRSVLRDAIVTDGSTGERIDIHAEAKRLGRPLKGTNVNTSINHAPSALFHSLARFGRVDRDDHTSEFTLYIQRARLPALLAAHTPASLRNVVVRDATNGERIDVEPLMLPQPKMCLSRTDIEARIASEFYFTAKDGVLGESHMGTAPAGRAKSLEQLTFCVLVLRNGTKVVGINHGSIDPKQHDAARGRLAAREHAVEQVWQLEGYLLREQLARA